MAIEGKDYFGKVQIVPESQIINNDPDRILSLDADGNINVSPAASVSDITKTSQLINDGEDGISPFSTEDYVNENIDFLFNNMQVPFGSVPVILPTAGEDELIREIGNVVFDKNTNQYIITYSGSLNPYTGGNTFVYWASSPTAEPGTWVKQGKLTNTPSEDPYLNIIGNTYRLLAERKSGNDHLGIELFIGTSLGSLVSQGIIIAPTPGTLYSSDSSSPVEFVFNGKYILIFEGRSSGNAGVILISESTDGINYTVNPVPIVQGFQRGINTWFTHCVPDDYVHINGRHYITLHAYNGSSFVCGVFESIDLVTWEDSLNTWISIDLTNNDVSGFGLMLLRKDRSIHAFNCIDSNVGIYQGRLNVRGNDKFRYSSRISPTTASELAASNRNEILETPITANTTWQIRSDLSSNAGYFKIIKNTSAFTLTLQPLAGVTINGSASNFSVLAGDSIIMYLTDVNTWHIASFPLLSSINNKVTKGGDSGAFDFGTTDDTTIGIKRNDVVVIDFFSSGMRMNEGYNIINRNNFNRFTQTLGTASLPSTDTRNLADAIAAKRTTNANASSTGAIHEFANNTGVVAAIQRTGKITAVAGTAPTDVIVKSQYDIKADLASPSFTGNPTAPTPAPGDNDTSIATTAFVTASANNKVTKGGDSDGANLVIGTNDGNNVIIRRNGGQRVVFNAIGTEFNTSLSGGSWTEGSLTFAGISTPTIITSARTDAQPVLSVQNTVTGGTGDLVQFKKNISSTLTTVCGVRPDGRAYGSDATAANDFITKGQYDLAKAIVDSALTTTQTAATLNTKYPSVPFPYVVFAPNVGSSMTYVKVNATQWMSYSGVLLS